MEISEKHFVNGHNIRPPHPDGFLELRVGMGCFWGAEKMFWQLEGVHTPVLVIAEGYKMNPLTERSAQAPLVMPKSF